MSEYVVLLSIPGLREEDVAVMRNLRNLTAGGEIAELTPGFPCVTCPVQAAMTTGKLPREHGVVGNGFYWRQRQEIEMWTSPNDCIETPQLWDLLYHHEEGRTSAVWFALHSRECEAEFACTPAPIHGADGSESPWCWTRPRELYQTLRDELGHFPLHHFWGPLANLKSTAWIVDSAIRMAGLERPNFFYVYLPHLDYAAQRTGPDSAAAKAAVADLDRLIGQLGPQFRDAYDAEPLWLAAGEYAIVPVSHVVYPNRVLREAGLLAIREAADGEYLDPAASRAWALADHQFSHVFVAGGDREVIARIVELFHGRQGIAEVLVGDERKRYGLDHPRSGEVVLISTPESWQAYYYWLRDDRAPPWVRTVDIHRKPGYDPAELHFDPASKSIPLRAELVAGSHGAPALDARQKTVLLASQPGLFPPGALSDRMVFDIVLRQFGITMR